MIKYFILLITLLLPVSAIAFQNEPDGFRGIPWGDNYENKKSELLPYQEGANNFYSRTNDKLEIGGAELKDIYYGYYKNKLGVVVLHSLGASNKYALLGALQEKFGKGHKPNRYIDDYYWFGQITDISYACNRITDKCTVWIRSKLIQSEQDAEAKVKAQGAAEDF